MRYLSCVSLLVAVGITPAFADPELCQKQIAKQYSNLKKKTLKGVEKCLDKDNAGTLPGPCPDATTATKLLIAQQKIEAKVAGSCSMVDATALGFGPTCTLGTASTSAENTCAGLPITSPAELAACISCWKRAELSEFLAVLYASHAQEVCGGTLGSGSTVCSALDCTTPLPTQRDLGSGGEYDCQKAIGKGGVKYLLAREKVLEKCALAGGTQTTCLADGKNQLALSKAEAKKVALITGKCGNRDPEANPPFCCKTTGNQCVAAGDRDACVTGGGQVQEGKTCGMTNTCDPSPGNQVITWWNVCPRNNACAGPALASLSDLIGCADDTADEIVSELLCFQFPRNAHADWPCPASASGAFLDMN